MNNLKKQILSVAVATSTVLSCVPVSMAAIPADVQGTRYEEPVQILSALNIMVGDENGAYRLDDTIIRSEVAKMAIHALGLEDAAESSKGQTMFDDVSAEHWANGYINLAVSQGIIEGDGDGNFRPNAPISYAEAMTIMVRATGYTVSAEENGGYPHGYMKTGTSNGLAKNVQGSYSDKISRGNVAYLTTNALESKLMEQTGFGSDGKYEITEKTLLKDKLKVTKDTGRITAIENTSLTGSSSLAKGQIKIDNKTYETAYNMNNLLGYNVTYYVKNEGKNDESVILAMPIQNQNNDLTISSELFSKLTTKNGNTAIEYFKDENTSKTNTAEISSDATLIYNGKYQAMDKNLIDLTDKSGNITLLDSNKNGKYDIVFVKNYENIVVDSVSSTGKIVDKYSQKVLKLDDTVDFRITKGLEEISVSDLAEYDVLSVAASLDKELYEVEVTNKTVEGKVTGKDSKGVLINGTKYKVAANYTDSIDIGSEGVFYLDTDGKIAAFDASKTLSSNYAYLMKAYYTKNTEKASFKLFTKDGKEVTLDANNKIKFNGKSNVKALDVVNSLNTSEDVTASQLVTYSTNPDNKITAINTAVDNSESGTVNTDKFTKNYDLTNAKFSKTLSKVGNVRVDDNTVIFDITENTDDYAIRNIAMFEDGQTYNASVYDMSENYTAKVIVVTNSQINAAADSSIAVVKDIVKATNNDDEQTDMLVALVDGKEVSIYAESENILVNGDRKLQEGDIIQYKANSKGEIVSIRLLLDITAKNNEFTLNPTDKLEIVYGKVTKKFSNSVNVSVNNSNTVNYTVPAETPVYSVDTTKSKNPITVAEISDIQNFDSDENNRIFIKIYDDIVSEIVIVK